MLPETLAVRDHLPVYPAHCVRRLRAGIFLQLDTMPRSEGWQSGRMRRSRKPFRAFGSDEGSNPSPSAQPGRRPHRYVVFGLVALPVPRTRIGGVAYRLLWAAGARERGTPTGERGAPLREVVVRAGRASESPAVPTRTATTVVVNVSLDRRQSHAQEAARNLRKTTVARVPIPGTSSPKGEGDPAPRRESGGCSHGHFIAFRSDALETAAGTAA